MAYSGYSSYATRSMSMPAPSGPPTPTQIIPRVYMSDLATAEAPGTLAAFGITHVLSVMPGSVHLPPNRGVCRLQIPIQDLPFEELAAHLAQTTQFISEALQDPRCSVLVHCTQGVSRSASVVSAYLIASRRWTVRQAVEYVKSKHRSASPNPGFVGQLQEYYDQLWGR